VPGSDGFVVGRPTIGLDLKLADAYRRSSVLTYHRFGEELIAGCIRPSPVSEGSTAQRSRGPAHRGDDVLADEVMRSSGSSRRSSERG
jgi:hypothetical protein